MRRVYRFRLEPTSHQEEGFRAVRGRAAVDLELGVPSEARALRRDGEGPLREGVIGATDGAQGGAGDGLAARDG